MNKTIITIVLSLFGLFNLSAQVAHDLEIYSEEGLKFTLVVNGKVINETPESNVSLKDITHDYALVVVRFEDENLGEIKKKNLQIGTPGTDANSPVSTVYKIIEKKGTYKLRFVSRSKKHLRY